MSFNKPVTFLIELMRWIARHVCPRVPNRPWMRYAGIVESGDPRSGQSIDEVVYDRED